YPHTITADFGPFAECCRICYFFLTAPAPTRFYTLSLHDALPICSVAPPSPRPKRESRAWPAQCRPKGRRSSHCCRRAQAARGNKDRKSTRLNSSHDQISYAVFCLKKKKMLYTTTTSTTSWHSRRW